MAHARMAGGFLLAVVAGALLLCCTAAAVPQRKFSDDFYAQSCPDAEAIVADRMAQLFQSDPNIAAQLVRLVFHDCFVRGCDASLLLDGTKANPAEKDAEPNFTVGAYDVIDDLKSILERQCPGTVSCADITVLAAREAISLAGGPWISVRKGRLDGRVSQAAEAAQGLPPNRDAKTVVKFFRKWGMRTVDMVALAGAHTIGRSICKSLTRRLAPNVNRSLNPTYFAFLNKMCGAPNKMTPLKYVYNDPITPMQWDNTYYKNILKRQATLTVDTALGNDRLGKKFVKLYASSATAWNNDFAVSFRKLSELQIAQKGEVRKFCRARN